jgi:phosphoglycerol transferase MdoB-like AlkP superfamily enzyme
MFSKIKVVLFRNSKTRLSYLGTETKQIGKHTVLRLLAYSTVLIFALEMLSRRSITKGLRFATANPLMFIYNVLIIMLTLSITMMFPRKRFMLAFITVFWLGLGIVNFVIMKFRTTPLGAMDFYMLKSVIGITHIYFNTFQIVLIVLAAVIVTVAMIFLWRKLRKSQAQFTMPLLIITVTAVMMHSLLNLSLKVNALSNNYGNLAEAYSQYGFAYCFSHSIFDRGIRKPPEYSEQSVDAVLKDIEVNINKVYASNPDSKGLGKDKSEDPSGIEGDKVDGIDSYENPPNVIMVQLESFFDVNKLKYYTFSENPVPNFTQLKRDYSSGYLTVPSIGAGTANTEFEIITGMNIEHFGAGEYPYKTILQSTTSESISYNLGSLGYYSHAIHNNTGTFYQRNTVFQNLGFDSFSSIEYMSNVEFNPIGWAKDNVLTAEILKALEARDTRDFIFTISVQPHGKYPNKVVDEKQRIKVFADLKKRQNLDNNDGENLSEENATGEMQIDEGYKNGFEYFVNQLAETDEFIGELIDVLSGYKEPTVVVFFGDHLPSLSLEDGDLVNNNRFQTEYVLWSNFPMGQVYLDLHAYQLSAYVLGRLGYENGVLTKFHQRYAGAPDYQDKLKLLQYDMLYGHKNVYKGENPYTEKPIQMGILEIVITNVKEKGEVIFVEGENFTPWSVVYMDGKPKETFFIDENTLIVPYEKFNGKSICVAQVTDNKVILSQSKEWKVHN